MIFGVLEDHFSYLNISEFYISESSDG